MGENRAQELEAKAERSAERFTWDFIGHLQSRKVKQVLPLRALDPLGGQRLGAEQLGAHGTPETEVLVEVNVAGEEGKSGIAPEELTPSWSAARSRVVGPDDDAAVRRATRRTAAAGSPRWPSSRPSAGCASCRWAPRQDYAVAAQEGATIVRIGTSLYT